MREDDGLGSLIIDSASRIFHDLGDPQTLNNAADERWKQPLWDQLEESGLALSWVPEEKGGAGAGIAAGFDVAHVSGRFAAPVPLAETLLAGWLLSRADIALPEGSMTLAPGDARDEVRMAADGSVSGRLVAVPFAPDSRHLALFVPGDSRPMVALAETSACALTPGHSIAGDPQADVGLDGVRPVAAGEAPPGLDAEAVMLMGAAVRARQMAGALQAILDLAVAYAQERVAFERPIGKFQAVQHNLARLAGEVAAADAASGSAADAIHHADAFDEGVFLEASAAKIRTGEAAGEGAAIAHQVFGAIGFSREHILHRYTRRLWAWRDGFGSESYWAERLGRHAAAAGADALWPMLAAH